jgi:hypothetical protein
MNLEIFSASAVQRSYSAEFSPFPLYLFVPVPVLFVSYPTPVAFHLGL